MEMNNIGEWQEPGTYKQIRKGDNIRFLGDEGVLLSDPEYIVTARSGLFYANVRWGDGHVQENFMICRIGLKWKPAAPERLQTRFLLNQSQFQQAAEARRKEISESAEAEEP